MGDATAGHLVVWLAVQRAVARAEPLAALKVFQRAGSTVRDLGSTRAALRADPMDPRSAEQKADKTAASRGAKWAVGRVGQWAVGWVDDWAGPWAVCSAGQKAEPWVVLKV